MNLDIWNAALQYNGWCSEEKAAAIYELTFAKNPKLCVEIGVFGARSLAITAMALRDAAKEGGSPGVVWGIDPWTKEAALHHEVDAANRGWWEKVNLDQVREKGLTQLGVDGLWPWTRVIVSKSADAAQLFVLVDWLHIDGNHNEECSVSDVLLWVPKVRQGGYIWFDDVDWPQTARAIALLENGMAARVRDIHSAQGGVARLYVKQ